MDENRRGYDLSAPRHLPGHGPFPRVDDHLVEPEVTRDQIIGGPGSSSFRPTRPTPPSRAG